MPPLLFASGLALALTAGALAPVQDDMAFGCSIAVCADITGDGRADVAIASPRVGSGGEVLLVSGLTGFTMSRCAAPPGMQCFGFRLWGAPDAPTGTYFLAQAYESSPLDTARRILVAVDAAKNAPAWSRVIEDGFLDDVELDCAFDPARNGRPWSWLVATKVRAKVSLRSLSMSTGEPRDVCSFEIPDDDRNGELVLSCGNTPASSGLALVSFGRVAAMVDLEEGKVVARFDIGREPDVQAHIRSNAITTDIDGDGRPDVALAIGFVAAKDIDYWGTVKWYSGRSGAFVREIDPALRLDGIGHRMSVARHVESDGDLLVTQYTTIFGSTAVYVSSRTGKRVGTPSSRRTTCRARDGRSWRCPTWTETPGPRCSRRRTRADAKAIPTSRCVCSPRAGVVPCGRGPRRGNRRHCGVRDRAEKRIASVGRRRWVTTCPTPRGGAEGRVHPRQVARTRLLRYGFRTPMITLAVLLALILSQKPSQDPCTAFKQKVHDVYDFRPSHLTAAQQQQKAKEMDEVWNMVKAKKDTLVPCLRAAVQDPKSDAWFRVDGSGLLCEIDPSIEAKKIRLGVWQDADWADLAPEVWVATMAEMGVAGLDTSRAGKRWLDDPSGKFYVAQHALQVEASAGALFLFGSMDEAFATPMLAKMAADPKQKSRGDAIQTLAVQATPDAFKALMALDPKSMAKSVRVTVSRAVADGAALSKMGASSNATREKLLAAFDAFLQGDHKPLDATQELAGGKSDEEWFHRLAGVLKKEDLPVLRQVRRKRMTYMSDEALEDYLQYSAVLLSFESTPEIVRWAAELGK